MLTIYTTLTTILCAFALNAFALPPYENTLHARDAAVDNIVYVTDANKFWYASPRLHQSTRD